MNVTSIPNSGIPASRPQDRPAVQAPSSTTAAGRGVLSEEEQRFFEEQYPGAVTELRSSPAYSRSGLQPAEGTGTLLDRKG